MTNSDSDLSLQAIMYVMDDPSLDRAAFEAKLAEDDGRLGEILADSVLFVQQFKAACEKQSHEGMVCVAPVGLSNSVAWSGPIVRPTTLVWLSMIAASVLVVGSVGWKLFTSSKNPQVAGMTAGSTQDSWDPFSSSILMEGVDLDSVVLAWTDIRSLEQEDSNSHLSVDPRDCLVAGSDISIAESDFPEWMLLAASVGGIPATESDVN